MQEGIGRGGYRVLAIVIYVLGALALVGTVYAFMRETSDAFNYAMSTLSAVTMTVLFVLLLVVLRRLPADPPAPSTTATFTPSLPGHPIAPARKIDFDFEVEEDPQDTPEADDAPATIRPFGRDLPEVPAKREVKLPPNRNLTADTKGWPKRKGPTGVTRGEMKQLQVKRMTEPVIDLDQPGEALVLPLQPKRMAARLPGDAPRAAAPKPSMAISKADVVEARMAFPNTTVPAGHARGKCGSCNAALYAPKKRPLHLRCPSCGKVTSLS